VFEAAGGSPRSELTGNSQETAFVIRMKEVIARQIHQETYLQQASGAAPRP